MRAALAAGAEIVGFLDADMSTPPAEIDDLLTVLARPGVQVAIGARIGMLGYDIERSAVRHYLGRVFATAASHILKAPVYDTQCGAKLFRAGPALSGALATPFLSRWAFDVEFLGRLADRYARGPPLPLHAVVEVPLAVWHDVGGSKLGFGGMARTLRDLARVAADMTARRKATKIAKILRFRLFFCAPNPFGGDGAARLNSRHPVSSAPTESETLDGSRARREASPPMKVKARRALKTELRRTYFEMDPRTLAFGRIFFALVLIGDLLRRIPWIREFYRTPASSRTTRCCGGRRSRACSRSSSSSSLPEESAFWFVHLLRLFLLLSDRLADAAVPRAVVRDDDEPAQPHAVRRELGRRGDGRADGVDDVPADRAPVLGRRRAGQPARAPRRDARGARGRAAARPTTRPPLRWPCSALLLQIAIIYWFNFVHKIGRDVEGRDRRLLRARTRSGSSPGSACRSASTSRTWSRSCSRTGRWSSRRARRS